jgi:hypothetical protein
LPDQLSETRVIARSTMNLLIDLVYELQLFLNPLRLSIGNIELLANP